MYGEEIKNEKPFEVSYDEKHEIWMICGTLTPGYEGGAANILAEDRTGQVLAFCAT